MRRYPLSRLFCFASLALAAVTAHAATPPDNVTVHYKDPQNFTEARNNGMSHRTDGDAYLQPLKTYIAERAAKVLSPGQRIDIEVTDVDRAGEYEPWRGPRFDDVRIIKDIYPPRINLNFTLYDANGTVLKQGSRKLSDIAFLSRGTVTPQQDSLRYEKGVIDLWLRGGEQKL